MTDAELQAEVRALLDELEALGAEIRREREALAPLEAQLADAARDYRLALGPLEQEALRLGMDLAELKAVDTVPEESAVIEPEPEESDPDVPVVEVDSATAAVEQRAAEEKDILREHLFIVLDGTSGDSGELIAELEGLCMDPRTSLADVLERLPWGPGWTERRPSEPLADQAARLRTWRDAMRRHLEAVRAERGRLEGDRRYALWRRREAGAEAWERYLAEAEEDARQRNEELRARLDEARAARHGRGGG